MAHIVTCYYCNGRFDRDKEPFVQVSARRYCHKECAPKEKQVVVNKEEQDYNDLVEYIKKLFKMPVLLNMINNQIREYKSKYGYSYSGMRKTLYWFYELKNHPVKGYDKSIGIIPYVYNDAMDYYYHLYLAEIAAKEDIQLPPDKKIIIHSPTCVPELAKRRPFNLEDEE